MRGASVRTAVASLLTAAALAALLVGWFGAGWAGVQAEQRAVVRAARDDGERTARELASALDAHLEALRRSEARRPYYEYQSLYHDPRGAAEGLAVVPSPLAAGSADPLVRAYFQIDGSGQVSMPTINDEAPELSAPDTLEEHRALRTALASAGLQITDDRPLVALNSASATMNSAEGRAGDPSATPPTKPMPTNTRARDKKNADVPTQTVVQVDPDVYAQNFQSQDIYKQTKTAPRQAPRVQAPVLRAVSAPVQIAMAPPEWRVAAIGAEVSLVLVRRVETPDGALTQGLVLDREAVVDWLAERAEGRDVTLELGTPTGDDGRAHAPLAVAASLVSVDMAAALERARAAAAAIERSFLGRLIPIALLALACGVLVVLLVARAERLAQQRAQFAAAAAHELRTPLAGLQLYGDMLADGLGDPGKQRDYARRMAEEASRLGRVVSNVLGFSQLERGNLSVHATPRDVIAATRAALDRARPALERAGVEVALDAPDGELSARLDEDAVLRVLGNLLDNAEKYGRGAADRRVRVEIARRGERVEVAVIDCGPGVVDGQARLFRPFWRGASSDGPAGLGLGLALSRSLARAMGGDLGYRPTPGGGATFVLSLAV